MSDQAVSPVTIMQTVVQSMFTDSIGVQTLPTGINVINYEAGRSLQILKTLTDLDTSISYKGDKFPLIAVIVPIMEERGRIGYYCKVKFPRIIISTRSREDTPVADRFAVDGNYYQILYPLYYEFLNRISQSPNIIDAEPNAIPHNKRDNPGNQPIGKGADDYIDSIEIFNLELILNQIKTC